MHHPNWSMGAKISVDSATMMNKGLELIEAHHLFGDAREPRSRSLVHPQSIVHSLVAFSDGSMLAQLGAPDMRMPIACALGWPARLGHQRAAARPGARSGGWTSRRPTTTLPGAAAGPARLAAGGHGTYHIERRQRGGGGGVPGAADRLSRHRPYGRGEVLERLPCDACA